MGVGESEAVIHPLDVLRIPACTYSHPQVAHVGLTEAQARAAGINVKTAGTPGRTCDQAPPPSDQTAPNPDHYYCGVSGFKPGPTFGVGFHTYFGQAVALNVELRDMMAQLNPSGRDVNGDGQADNSDLSWTHTWVLGGNLVVYLPFTANVSP